MNQCDNYSMAVQLYLDNELLGSAQEFFLTHVDECAHCREQLESEQRLSALLRRTHPLYSAGEELRARVESVVRDHSTAAGKGDSSSARGLSLFLIVRPSMLGGQH
jgi:mycothiol system anti-sigma-R factor